MFDAESKKYYLTESKTFCMLPWIHVHKSPDNLVGGCCISTQNSKVESLSSVDDLINSDQIKQVRKDMLAEIPVSACDTCYRNEKRNGDSFRMESNRLWEHRFDESVPNTESDGTLTDFRMRYFDIRFNNVCNMKCRSCGPNYSSQWQKEAKQYPQLKMNTDFVSASDPRLLLDLMRNQCSNLERLYFAGGEPLVQQEHYQILERLIEIGNTDVILTYNTNLSNLNFKDYDLVKLWKNFAQVDIHASIDSWGERAELIRKGTDWDTVLKNLKTVSDLTKQNDNFVLHINCVASLLNYPSMYKFVRYIIEEGIIYPTEKHARQGNIMFYHLTEPDWLCAHHLPDDIKRKANRGLDNLKRWIKRQPFDPERFDLIKNIDNLIHFVNSESIDVSVESVYNIRLLDEIRLEDTLTILPELDGLL